MAAYLNGKSGLDPVGPSLAHPPNGIGSLFRRAHLSVCEFLELMQGSEGWVFEAHPENA